MNAFVLGVLAKLKRELKVTATILGILGLQIQSQYSGFIKVGTIP